MARGSLNQKGCAKGVQMGHRVLSIVIYGPNRHNMLCGQCLREAGAGSSNLLTPTNLIKDLAFGRPVWDAHL